MIIGVASGKGGTGKTTVAVSLALASAECGSGRPLLLDCDVEEPNAGLFLDLSFTGAEQTGISIPVIDADKCTACGKCASVCAWNALAVAAGEVMNFPELCHGCGSCSLVCPRDAISQGTHVTGTIETGRTDNIDFARGTLNVGESMPVPVISSLLASCLTGHREGITVIDCSPGTSCPMVEAVSACDYVILVTEPTPFGLHDLRAASNVVVGQLGLPAGVLINKSGPEDGTVEDFCREQELPIIGRIPLDRRIAESLSEGIPLVEAMPGYGDLFRDLLEISSRSVKK